MAFPFLAVAMVASAGISAVAQKRAGDSAALASEQQADQMEIDRSANELKAMQVQNTLLGDYNFASATNDAQFSFMLGGGESTSVDAFKRAQREIFIDDIKAAQLQSSLESSNMTVAALLERQRGTNARTVGKINALSTLVGAGADIYKTF
jgi:hypothetical protein|tara:strand:+ start:556 stop:1008 length:453 start_codon:yes stop_codon:yes gene_type:complete